MPRQIQERWCRRDRAWLVPLGAYNEKTRRRNYVALRDENGVRIPESDVAGAKAALARLLAAEQDRERQTAGPTVNDVIRGYLRWHRDEGSAPSTIEGHKFHLTKFGEFVVGGVALGDRPAASIALRDLTLLRRAMESRQADESYVRHLYMTVKACWNWAARPVEDREPERLIASNPFEKLKTPSAGVGADKFVPVDVTRQLLAFAASHAETVHPNGVRHYRRWLLALKLIVFSGCRPGEAASLRWDEIDWDERVIVIPPPKLRGKLGGRTHKTGRKTGKFRRIDVRPELIEELKALQADPTSHHVWPFAANGQEQSSAPTARLMGVWFKGLRETAITASIPLPKECTLYWFRHTWQTIGLMVASAEAVSLAAGNTPDVLLRTYASAQNRQVREVGNLVAAVMDKIAAESAGPTP